MSWIDTFWTACRVRLYHLWQFINNFFRYYLWHPTFFLADMLVVSQYFFKSPHRIIRHFDEKRRSGRIGPYGETDFRTMERLLKAFDISPSASFADLGAGRGRMSFFLRLVKGQREVLAIEYHPLMVKRAERVRRWLGIKNLTFRQGDWFTTQLGDIDVVYLYGYVVQEKEAKRLARHMSLLKGGTKIITISSWFGEMMPDSFRLEKKIPIRFEWGTTEAYLQTVVWP